MGAKIFRFWFLPEIEGRNAIFIPTQY